MKTLVLQEVDEDFAAIPSLQTPGKEPSGQQQLVSHQENQENACSHQHTQASLCGHA
jgi:hypothetical protein